MKHEIIIVSIKQIHHRALKDISEVLEQKLSNSKDISEAQRVFEQIPICVRLSLIKEFQILILIQTASKSKENYNARIAQLM